jgi:hypothetical protein
VAALTIAIVYPHTANGSVVFEATLKHELATEKVEWYWQIDDAINITDTTDCKDFHCTDLAKVPLHVGDHTLGLAVFRKRDMRELARASQDFFVPAQIAQNASIAPRFVRTWAEVRYISVARR